MPRVKKATVNLNLAEENEKLSSEIAKAEAKIAEAKAKIKANTEKIFREKIDKIVNSGYTLDEVISLIEVMVKKNVTIQDIISHIDESPSAEPSEPKFDNADPEVSEKDAEELNKMMASLPSYD